LEEAAIVNGEQDSGDNRRRTAQELARWARIELAAASGTENQVI